MNLFPQFSVRRPITVAMIFLAICVLGMVAWSRIPLELLPSSIAGGSLWLSVPYPDSQPRETEEKVTKPVEEQLSQMAGLKNMRSYSRSNGANFRLRFHRSTPMDIAYNTIVDRMDRVVPELPEDAQDFFVYKWDASDTPIMWMGVGMEGEQEEQYDLLYKVVTPRVERVKGVGGVNAWGPASKNIYVGFSRDSLIQHRLSHYQILQQIRQENFQIPSGKLSQDGRIQYVRSLATLEKMSSLTQFPVRENLTLSDVASVEYRMSLDADISHIEGKDGAGLVIRKESDANTVATSRAVHSQLDQLKERGDVEFFVFFDQGELIQEALENLEEAALTGGLFAIGVLFLFLRRMGMTLLIAACIPFTLVTSVAAMYLRGGSLNIISLIGLMLAVGMVVDNAIVVVEAINGRLKDGETRKEASINGTSEVALAISLSTLTTIAVFLPIIVLNRDAEYAFFLVEIGFPIIVALCASLLAALLFTPMTTAYGTRIHQDVSTPTWLEWLIRWYQRGLSFVLRRRADAFLGLLCLVMLTYFLPFKAVGCSGDNEDMNEFEISYRIPPQFTHAERVSTVKAIEEMVETNRERWGVEFHWTHLSGGSNSGELQVHLDSKADIELSQKEIIAEAEAGLPEIPGVAIQIGWSGKGGENRRFNVTIRGEDTARLEEIAQTVRLNLLGVPGVKTATISMADNDLPELQLRVDREAAGRLGISAQSIAWNVAGALRSNELPEQTIDGEDVSVIARFRAQDRIFIQKLLDFPIYSSTQQTIVPLRQLVTVQAAQSLGEIKRLNRQTSFPLTIQVEDGADVQKVREQVNAALSLVRFPSGYGFDPPFDLDDLADQTAMQMSLLMSVVLVFIIMGALFESFLMPVVIIATVPLAAVGAYWALYATGSRMDNLAGIGVVILIGVVVNNGIVLIEYVNRLRGSGLERYDALMKAGSRRLSPILMTALTTICGLIPMALGGTTSAGVSYAPMGRVVAGGLVAGTFLTLFFIPLLYVVLDDMRIGAMRWLTYLAARSRSRRTA